MINCSCLRLILPLFVSLAVVNPQIALALTNSPANNQTNSQSQVLDGKSLQPVLTSQIIQNIQPGSVLILGENHGLAAHRDQHLVLLQLLRDRGLKVSVGMEFINYPDQIFLNQYLSHEVDDEQFLKLVDWKGFPFEFYKQQILFPNFLNGEKTLGLNIPRLITSKIAKTGLESLTVGERNLLPTDFKIGRDSYKQRFANTIHVPPGPVLDRYFVAQSAWDDTMAFQSVNFLNANPDQVLVIVVGEFHAQYGGGLADRILARKPGTSVTALSQIWAVGISENGSEVVLTDEEIQALIQPSKTEGPRGDFIWISKPSVKN